jgi:hypothetical protein
MGMPPGGWTQSAFRGRDDDVAINSSTFTHALNTDWSQDVDADFRVRYVIQETDGGSGDESFKWEYNRNGTGWNDVSGTSPLQWSSSSWYSDGQATSQVIGSGSFVTGEGSEEDNEAGPSTFAGNDETEHEGVFTIDSAQVSNGDTIDLRMVEIDGTAIAYTNTPTITVVKAVTGPPVGSLAMMGCGR